MIEKISRTAVRQRKHLRVREKISGTAEKPRLCVFRSNKNIEAQLIDDVKGVTKVCFDRNGYLYHGRVAALADAAREGGLEF